MEYLEALSYLDSLQMHKIKLGLEAMRGFLDRVGSPEKGLRFVHVAGTNGKGSVSATLFSIMKQAGCRVGLYTSPHLSDVRERFRLGDRFISKEEFARLATRIRDILEPERITYFEFGTALALLWFAENDVDLVILEVGMGGRLDATNVVTPLISVITSISMDHEAYLGTNLTQVAGEKAGIIKPGVPVVSSAVRPEASAVVEAACRERGAPLYLFRRDFDYAGEGESWRWRGTREPVAGEIAGLRCGLLGDYQRQNSSVAIAAALLLRQAGFAIETPAITAGVAQVSWPGRMEYFHGGQVAGPGQGADPAGRWYLLDGAHNPDGVARLAESLAAEFAGRRLVCVWGAMGDKDIAAAFAVLEPVIDRIILTRAPGERSAAPGQMLQHLSPEGRARAECEADIGRALARAGALAGPEDCIVVAGSLYLLGEARRILRGEVVDG
jgi:dihydrofolate synthase/folylpolyglutamate synthase